MNARRLLAVILALAAAAAGGAGAGGRLDGEADEGAGGDAEAGRVVRIVDGDTIAVQLGATREKMRYIGIDTIVLWSRRVIPSTSAPAQRR